MNPRVYFPLGKASGKAFCNRKVELEWLVDNIRVCKHSLLVAPRRYGKSSLADRAIELSGFPATILNFNICSDEQDVELLIRQGVSKLVGKAIGSVEKAANSIKNYVSGLTPRISFGVKYARLELVAHDKSRPAANIEEALMLLERLLREKRQHAVVLLDEFQVLGLIAKGKGVEAAIRNAAQATQHLSIIFSGSNRSLLRSMFEDRNRPLYKLCRKLYLDRIEQMHYQKHINKAAKLVWKAELNEQTLEHIMLWSDRHPYYVNYLCDVIWTECTALPKVIDVERAWNLVVEEEQSDANAEIAQLSMGQRKVLKYIVNQSGKNLMSASTVKSMGMALSSISSAVSALIEKDIIEKQHDEYVLINPIIKYLLKSDMDD